MTNNPLNVSDTFWLLGYYAITIPFTCALVVSIQNILVQITTSAINTKNNNNKNMSEYGQPFAWKWLWSRNQEHCMYQIYVLSAMEKLWNSMTHCDCFVRAFSIKTFKSRNTHYLIIWQEILGRNIRLLTSDRISTAQKMTCTTIILPKCCLETIVGYTYRLTGLHYSGFQELPGDKQTHRHTDSNVTS